MVIRNENIDDGTTSETKKRKKNSNVRARKNTAELTISTVEWKTQNKDNRCTERSPLV